MLSGCHVHCGPVASQRRRGQTWRSAILNSPDKSLADLCSGLGNIFSDCVATSAYFRTRVLFSKRDRPDVVIECSGRTRGNERYIEINSACGSEYFLCIFALWISNARIQISVILYDTIIRGILTIAFQRIPHHRTRIAYIGNELSTYLLGEGCTAKNVAGRKKEFKVR